MSSTFAKKELNEAAELTGLALMAHLYRRAGFGGTREELESAIARGYEATVDELLHPELQPAPDMELLYRYYPECHEPTQLRNAQLSWVYRMMTTRRPLEEKMTLFWHHLFATGYAKVQHVVSLEAQMETFRGCAFDNFRTILLSLSRDPAMILWLDNQENTAKVHNENYGRELLELFSMGIGNYSEDDVKSCARAFTGWTLRDTLQYGAYGPCDWVFEYRADLHDDTEKLFLGERGAFDGEDVIDIIMRQPATAQFVARRLHNFFVSDEPDQAAIDELAEVFAQTHGDIRPVMRALFLSKAFRSEAAYFAKVKSPVELVVGIARLIGDFDLPKPGLITLARATVYMGQDLLNPPTVEGWHTGTEWIDSGLMIERVNFAAEQISNTNKPGVRTLVDRLAASGGVLAPDRFIDACLDLLGPLQVTVATRTALVEFAENAGPINCARPLPASTERLMSQVLSLIVSTREFQLA